MIFRLGFCPLFGQLAPVAASPLAPGGAVLRLGFQVFQG